MTSLEARVIDELFRWIRIFASHGAAHPLAVEASATLAAAIAEARPPFGLQFVLGAVFRDRKLLPLREDRFVRARAIAQALTRAGIAEISFLHDPTVNDLVALGSAIAESRPGADDLEQLRLTTIQWRSIPHATRGAAGEAVDRDVAATAELSLALASAETLPASGPWPWNIGGSIVRRLDRALSLHTYASLRAIELSPSPWSPTRRATSAAVHVLLALRALGATAATQRVATHAALLVARRGLRERDGDDLTTTTGRIGRELWIDAETKGAIEPHQLKVACVVHAASSGNDAQKQFVMIPLLFLAYDLERRRVPERGRVVLSRVDLLALAVSDRRYDPAWVRLLINACGVVPPGAVVELRDGRIGVVLGPSPHRDPWRPEVLIEGRIVIPDDRVRLRSATRDAT